MIDPDAQTAPQPAAVVLPTVEEVARLAYKLYWGDLKFAEEFEDAPWPDIAQAVLDLIAGSVTPWKPVAPGTTIKAGTRYRTEWDHVPGKTTAIERTNSYDFTVDPDAPARFFIDPRTVPAEPEDPRVAVAIQWWRGSIEPMATDKDAARDLLARLDALGTWEPRPTKGDLHA